MNYLVDTHVLLWAITDDDKNLSSEVRELLAGDGHVIYVSIATLWELQIKQSIGKIKLPLHFFDQLPLAGYEILPIQLKHIKNLAKLPALHRDPFDRMIISQAQLEQLTLVTHDALMMKYPVNILKT
ncbi:MAG: hypothetical protein ACD_73C00056G0001 [uncultured bacterium]|nr:MAG: hypothetical protein ACD_73C00056G0001 [uncultured bacterium]